MKVNTAIILLSIGIAVLVLGACRPAVSSPPTLGPASPPPGAAFTQAAATLASQRTEQARNVKSPTPTSTATITPTGTSTPTRTATLTPKPTASATPTITPTSTATPFGATYQTPNASGSLCNKAEFVEDVTIPDNTRIPPGSYFTKTWRIRNAGYCTWTEDYALVFVNRDQMNGPMRQRLAKTVKPRETIDISVDLKSPNYAGEFQGNWMLSDAEFKRFGTGAQADGVIWVRIRVVISTPESGDYFYFAPNVCSANWVSSAGSLPCSGSPNNPRGWVLYLSNPDFESRHEDQPTLWTNPPLEDGGIITGTYATVPVTSGDHFVADIGCLYGFEGCNVQFSVKYQLRDGDIFTLGEYNEVYDDVLNRIDIVLDDLEDRNVTFFLVVESRGDPAEAAAAWLNPYIGPPPD
jgi:hypothetical protein